VKFAILVAAIVLVMAAAGLGYVVSTGLSARPAPGALETRVSRAVRAWAVPREIRQRTSPFPSTKQTVGEGLHHFARNCASCHANDGSGNATMGKGLYPKAPDMRLPATQNLTDGELFYFIEYGIRFTGMPAWGDGSAKGEELGWKLVHFIRHLPQLTPDEVGEMEGLNPQ